MFNPAVYMNVKRATAVYILGRRYDGIAHQGPRDLSMSLIEGISEALLICLLRQGYTQKRKWNFR